MMPFIMQELEEWRGNWGRRGAGALAILLVIAVFFSRFQLIVGLMVVTAWFVWLGWMSANRGWQRRSGWTWIAHRNLAAPAWVAGKLLAYLVVAVANLVVLAPILILLAATWGMPATGLCLALGVAVTAGGLVASLSLFCGANDGVSGDLINFCLTGLWLGLTILPEALRHFSPFVQIWNLVEGRDEGAVAAALLANAGLLAACAALAAVFLSKSIRRLA